MKVTKLVVGKGRTARPSEQEQWIKEFYQLEIELADDKELEDARAYGLSLIDNWLSEAPTAPQYIPRLDEAELEELPWQTRNKELAKPGQWAWLFGPESTKGAPEGAQELIKAIEASKDGKLELGAYEYTFSKDRAFVQRRPVKKK